MIKDIKTTRVPLGWKVYIDGVKYPKKPFNCYITKTEKGAVKTACEDAGIDPAEVKDIIFDAPAEVG